MSPTGIDQSWGFADPVEAKRAGVQVVSMYLSHDPSKNASPAKIRAYHAQGIGVLLNWESAAGRPLLGSAAGREDAGSAVAQIHALYTGVGYRPRSKLAIPFSCDRDTNPSQYAAIDGYYAATKAIVEPEFVNGVYGEADVVEHLHAAGLTGMEWQTLAWSNGRRSPEADFYQSSINDTLGGASVDFDEVIHLTQIGAWWPPGSRWDAPAAEITPTLSEKAMLKIAQVTARRLMLAVLTGQDHGHWTHARYPWMVRGKGQGLQSEVDALKARVAKLEASK